MRANTKQKQKMGKRFTLLVGLAAAGVMALGAQTGAPAQAVVKYNTKVTIGAHNRDLFTGSVESNSECERGRRVDLFALRPGADRRVGTARTKLRSGSYEWGISAKNVGRDAWYAKVRREVHDEFVCGGDRSRLHDDRDSVVRALGAQTAFAATYNTRLTIYHEQFILHGVVRSEVRRCTEGREVIVFRKRPGPDRKLGATRSGPQQAPSHNWYIGVKALVGKGKLGRVYAKVTPKVGDGFVCRADKSEDPLSD